MAEIFQFEKWLLNRHNNGMDFYFAYVMYIFSIMQSLKYTSPN